jgi:hypothetical protein
MCEYWRTCDSPRDSHKSVITDLLLAVQLLAFDDSDEPGTHDRIAILRKTAR